MARPAPLLDDLAQLVSLPSVSRDPCGPVADWMAERCEALGMHVTLVPSGPGKVNVLASAGPPGTDGLVLSGHMDVVPTEGQPWTSDPFRLTERDGLLYGRGAADMKGFLACTLRALAAAPLHRLRRELLLVWTCDEEIGCFGSAAVASRLVEDGRPVPRACLIGEPTGFRVLRMHPGHVQVSVTVGGRAAHSSRPDLGINAIEAAAEVVLLCRELGAQLADEADARGEPRVVLNVGRIHGGAAINIVPDRCVVELGYRPQPGGDDHAVLRRLRALLADRLAGSGCTIGATCDAVVPTLHTPSGTALAALLAPHAAPGDEAATFATDGGNLARAGMEPLVFGPGAIEVAHQADEHVARADLERAVGVIGDLVAARCLT